MRHCDVAVAECNSLHPAAGSTQEMTLLVAVAVRVHLIVVRFVVVVVRLRITTVERRPHSTTMLNAA